MSSSHLTVGMLVFAATAVWFMPLGIVNQILACAACVVSAGILLLGGAQKKK
jgi:hypothetical protein